MDFLKKHPFQATRQSFGESLVRLGVLHPEIVVLDADLSKSTKSELFAKKFPSRFFEMGIAEANMIGTAAGLSFVGKLPFLCSFGCFLTGRYDTIRMSVAYSQANVRLVGTHAGLGVGEDGFSQMGLEDVALMRVLPQMGVFQPMDGMETHALMDSLVKVWKGPAYLRLTRQNLPQMDFVGRQFEFGKLLEIPIIPDSLKPGRPRVGCLASGATVAEAVQAAFELEKMGVSTRVWNVHSLKPFDREGFIHKVIPELDYLVSVEDHSLIGGLGSCVSEVLAGMSQHPPLLTLGVADLFGESGLSEQLYEKFGISAASLIRHVLLFCKK